MTESLKAHGGGLDNRNDGWYRVPATHYHPDVTQEKCPPRPVNTMDGDVYSSMIVFFVKASTFDRATRSPVASAASCRPAPVASPAVQVVPLNSVLPDAVLPQRRRLNTHAPPNPHTAGTRRAARQWRPATS